jgi:WbqC-like protein family
LILPLAYCGNLEYFSHWLNEEKIIVDLHEPFQKQTYRSRCEIASANGKLTLTVPVTRPNGKESLMHEILISESENWRKDHLKALESAYSSSPFYEFYRDDFSAIILGNFKYLWELNAKLNDFFLAKIGINAPSEFSNQQIRIQENDARIDFNSKRSPQFKTKRYMQPFETKHGFIGNLSVLDLLFNEGPNSITVLETKFL